MSGGAKSGACCRCLKSSLTDTEASGNAGVLAV